MPLCVDLLISDAISVVAQMWSSSVYCLESVKLRAIRFNVSEISEEEVVNSGRQPIKQTQNNLFGTRDKVSLKRSQ